MDQKKILKIVLIICFFVIIIDQTSKILISHFLKKEINLIPNVLVITKVRNEGIAFGINKKNITNIALSVLIIILLFRYMLSQKEKLTKMIVIFLGLIIAGGISNVIDRIFNGAVFDFIKIGNVPVFNIADICVVCGWFLFVIHFLKDTAIDIKAEIPVKDKKK